MYIYINIYLHTRYTVYVQPKTKNLVNMLLCDMLRVCSSHKFLFHRHLGTHHSATIC